MASRYPSGKQQFSRPVLQLEQWAQLQVRTVLRLRSSTSVRHPRIRAALLPFFALANPISLVELAAVGMFGWREVYASALLLPGLVAGYLAAPLLMRILSPAAVRVAILLISAASGVALLVKG